MCGLVGIYSPTAVTDAELQLFKNLLLVDQIRGMHATGVIKVDTKRQEPPTYHKAALDAVDFLAMESTKDFLSKERGNIYIGHNRYATMGNKTDHENAHPFVQDHITLVHNGGVDNWGLDLLEGSDDPQVAVDSHMVTMTLAKYGVKKAVTEKLSGAFALVWWDSNERSLNFIRNSERPLFMATTTAGNLVWASEKGMLDVFLARSSKTPGYRVAPVEILVDTHYKFCFNEKGARIGTAPTATPMKFLELDVPKSQAAWYDYQAHNGYSQTNYRRSSAGNYAGRDKSSQEEKNTKRINKLLETWGLPFRRKGVITADVDRVEGYTTQENYCRVYAIERNSRVEVEVWGLNRSAMKGIETLRLRVENAYEVNRLGKKSLTITCNDAHVSFHDKMYNPKLNQNITRNNPSVGEPVFGTPIIKNKEVSNVTPITKALPISYPLKVHGHTFQNNLEFTDFASQGCSVCGHIPTAYSKDNREMVVLEGSSFRGLLNECEYICGLCMDDMQ